MDINKNTIDDEWTLTDEETQELMSHYPDIWVLTELEETVGVYAGLDEETLRVIAERVFDRLEDEDDDDAPKSVADTVTLIKETLGDDNRAELNVFKLEKWKLLLMPDEEDYRMKRGDKVWEVAHRYTAGCDNSYILIPQAFHLLYHEDLYNPLETEWIERTIE